MCKAQLGLDLKNLNWLRNETVPFVKRLGWNFRHLRRINCLRAVDVAREIGCSVQCLLMLERGQTARVNLLMAIALCKIYAITVSEFFEDLFQADEEAA